MNEASPAIDPSVSERKSAWRRVAFWVVVVLWLPLVGGIGWMTWRGVATAQERQRQQAEEFARRRDELLREAQRTDAEQVRLSTQRDVRPTFDAPLGRVLRQPPTPVSRPEHIDAYFAKASVRRAAQRLAGVSEPRDYAQAVAELKDDAERNHPVAILLLAEALLDGDPANGVSPNRAEGERWLQHPAAIRSPMAVHLQERVRRMDRNSATVARNLDVVSLETFQSSEQGPRPLSQVNPIFPLVFRYLEIGGSVTVEFDVNEKGNVIGARAVKSTNPGFEAAAIEAVSAWKFVPGKKNGSAVTTRMAVPIVFTLNEEPAKR